ncbi:MAG: cell division protein FtsZ [Dehalococcoidales bacterium]|nr:cell division protein FtsZ [Dehalococcoidales bacterium]MDD3265204.1 cell division protein FtsZ [Dehalococcoidales bacterium]MDD4322776.1 cell division protein FtsZ [Dehalococcoidales bacterium]MDD4793779.1 cell division protein FtsZ [Dehalococcoidales bacterium]MDD5498772.1 cell division protein FtsZ [Dehalococcoidales bacterium]
MKLVVIGIGQCGGRIADEFARLQARAMEFRRLEIILDTFAVNTDAADMASIRSIRNDYQHKILAGAGKTRGHGVAKISEMGAEIIRADSDKIIDAMRSTPRFFEADAFLVIAGTAGGTGGGGAPVLVQELKNRFDRPVYGMLVLPFDHEENTEERTIYNSALCLKATSSVADAIFLVDNQRYVRKDFSLKTNITGINRLVTEPFLNPLSAGEEKRRGNIGSRLLDAGDILQTLEGWSAISYGVVKIPFIPLPWDYSPNFRKKGSSLHRGIEAMDQALGEMSIDFDPEQAYNGLYLISAPQRELNMDMVKELGDHLRSFAPQAVIRNGDYPRNKASIDVTVILSKIASVPRVSQIYAKASCLPKLQEKRAEEARVKTDLTEEAGRDVPSLL